jgi:hypothetical protein
MNQRKAMLINLIDELFNLLSYAVPFNDLECHLEEVGEVTLIEEFM